MNKRELGQLIIKFEEWTHYSSETPTLMVSVYTAGGDYIGSLDSQICTLLSEYVIVPEKWKATHGVCSIGKSLKDGKWYGWSHRAIFGFGIGDVVKEGDEVSVKVIGFDRGKVKLSIKEAS